MSKAKALQLLEARKKANPEWFKGQGADVTIRAKVHGFYAFDEIAKFASPCPSHEVTNEENRDFCILAANDITDVVQWALEVEKDYEGLKSHHEITHKIICDAQGLSPENGKALLYNMDQDKLRIQSLERQLEKCKEQRNDLYERIENFGEAEKVKLIAQCDAELLTVGETAHV